MKLSDAEPFTLECQCHGTLDIWNEVVLLTKGYDHLGPCLKACPKCQYCRCDTLLRQSFRACSSSETCQLPDLSHASMVLQYLGVMAKLQFIPCSAQGPRCVSDRFVVLYCSTLYSSTVGNSCGRLSASPTYRMRRFCVVYRLRTDGKLLGLLCH